MIIKKQQVFLSSMLHDIGKVILRSGLSDKIQTHSLAGADYLQTVMEGYADSQLIIDGICYHHVSELNRAQLSDDHIAHIICEADNIAAGTDRRSKPTEGESDSFASFRSTKCLDSVFNIVQTDRNRSDTSQEYRLIYGRQEEKSFVSATSQSEPLEASQGSYAEIWTKLSQDLSTIDWSDPKLSQSLLNLMEGYLSYIPSSTDINQVSDISLYDHSKLTACIAMCMYDWAKANNKQNYRELIGSDTAAFRSRDIFLLVHADLSGIQDFIYTISSSHALKSLRGRSFYLELMIEHIADELLDELELTRANLIYSGGGGFYMLLPNTKSTIDVLEKALETVNQRLIELFGLDLYFGLAWTSASASNFIETADASPMSETFQKVSQTLSYQKTHRYKQHQLRQLFIPKKPEQGARECRICGSSARLSALETQDTTGEPPPTTCSLCQGLIELGGKVIAKSENVSVPMAFIIQQSQPDKGVSIPLPTTQREAWLTVVSPEKVPDRLQQDSTTIDRVYTKNYLGSGLDVSTRLWVGDYNYCAGQEGAVEFKDFVEMRGNQGIERIAVLRADVDNLGNLFALGLRGQAKDKSKYETLGRYAALSRSLSLFFKGHINHIAAKEKRSLVLVYAGGDDVFAVGAWDEIIEFAVDLREAFRQFTADKLSLSAGIAFFRHNYPISRMAQITGELEAQAKSGNKDQIALFGMQTEQEKAVCRHVYTWDQFSSAVIPKKDFLVQLLCQGDSNQKDQATAGKSFLYKVLELLITAEADKLSLARLAYLLARREPSSSAPDKAKEEYMLLKNNLYTWATDKQSRRELITAMMLGIYAVREKGD